MQVISKILSYRLCASDIKTFPFAVVNKAARKCVLCFALYVMPFTRLALSLKRRKLCILCVVDQGKDAQMLDVSYYAVRYTDKTSLASVKLYVIDYSS